MSRTEKIADFFYKNPCAIETGVRNSVAEVPNMIGREYKTTIKHWQRKHLAYLYGHCILYSNVQFVGLRNDDRHSNPG